MANSMVAMFRVLGLRVWVRKNVLQSRVLYTDAVVVLVRKFILHGDLTELGSQLQLLEISGSGWLLLRCGRLRELGL
jgi:hypothetical protein